MVKARGGTGFAAKAFESFRVGRKIREKQFNRDGAFELDVGSGIDCAHAAAPDSPVEAIFTAGDIACAVTRRNERRTI
jgi:hypothetical protein